MKIYSPIDEKFYDTPDTIDTFDGIMPSPVPCDEDYCIPNLDDEHEDEEEDWPYLKAEEKFFGLNITKLWWK